MCKSCRILALALILALPVYSAEQPPSGYAGDYEVDPAHTSAIFRIKHLNVSHFYGRFNEVSGRFTINEADATKSSFEIQVKTESIDTNLDGRDRHLRSPDFFNAKQYPTLSFKSATVKMRGSDAYDVTGELTLHGVTKEVSVTLDRSGAGPGMKSEFRCGFETAFTIRRSEFGMDFMLDQLGDEVRIIVSIEGIRK